jgi:Rad3-related DNA helicase
LNRLYEIASVFEGLEDESYFSVEREDNDSVIKIVTTNLSKRFMEIVDKNKILVMMSGTVHSENVLKNIFGIENFKIIEAETKQQGELIKSRQGYEMDCAYQNFSSGRITREGYLKAFSKAVLVAKRPTLIHLTSFNDLPTEIERIQWDLDNLPTQNEFFDEQNSDPLGERVRNFKNKEQDILFTTRCNRGVDFPGDSCNSIIISRFPYPNISSLFWRILKKNKPNSFRDFYLDKAKRELLQKIYRGLRSKQDKVELLSPDKRVIDFSI